MVKKYMATAWIDLDKLFFQTDLGKISVGKEKQATRNRARDNDCDRVRRNEIW